MAFAPPGPIPAPASGPAVRARGPRTSLIQGSVMCAAQRRQETRETGIVRVSNGAALVQRAVLESPGAPK